MELRSVALPFNNISILQDVHSQGISTDSEFLYKAIAGEYAGDDPNQNRQVMELGTGNGIISIMLALTFPHWQISALEAQISLYLLARENIARSGAKIDLQPADLRKAEQLSKTRTYDLVLANPPYYPITTVRISPSVSRTISRTDILCSMDDLLSSLKRILHPQGRGFILYPEARNTEFLSKAESYGFQIIDEKRDGISPGRGNKTKTVFIVGHKTSPAKG